VDLEPEPCEAASALQKATEIFGERDPLARDAVNRRAWCQRKGLVERTHVRVIAVVDVVVDRGMGAPTGSITRIVSPSVRSMDAGPSWSSDQGSIRMFPASSSRLIASRVSTPMGARMIP
jgi:hypothetical protein